MGGSDPRLCSRKICLELEILLELYVNDGIRFCIGGVGSRGLTIYIVSECERVMASKAMSLEKQVTQP